jgi:AraC-like DNA-binding protein
MPVDTLDLMSSTASAPPQVVFLGGPGIDYQERAPGPDLAPWIQSFWHLRCVRDTTLRIPPDGCMDLINGDVVGSLTEALVLDLPAGDEAFGIRFRPGAFTALYGVPADELIDLRLPLSEVTRPRDLLAAAAEADPPDPLAEAAMFQPDLKALARDTGYSERHLRRKVVTATGHSPRKLARIGRMQALLAAGRGESWARTAAEFGYYDESHMINDVKALTAATPQSLLAARGQREIGADSPSAGPPASGA